MAADDTPGPRKQPRFKGSGAPATAVDLNIISDYAALVGNYKVGTTAERTAATSAGEVWTGLLWRDTDQGITYIYNAGWLVLLQDTGWTLLTLQNSWVNFGGAYQVARARKLNGIVYVEGLIKSGAVAAGTVITQLPAGMRPPSQLMAVTAAGTSGVPASLDITAGGDVSITAGANATFTSLLFSFSAA